LQVIKGKIFFEEPKEEKLDWDHMIEKSLECCHFARDMNDDDPREIHIPESEGHNAVEGPELEASDYTKIVKVKKVNIDIEENPKIANIGDYWDDETVSKIAKLLGEARGGGIILNPPDTLELKYAWGLGINSNNLIEALSLLQVSDQMLAQGITKANAYGDSQTPIRLLISQ